MRIALVAALTSVVLACNASDATTGGAFHASGKRAWSCAAYCITEFHCTRDGDSTWNSKLKQSHGEDAAAAFANLVDQCDSAASMLVTHFHCADGNTVREGATIASSCAAN